MKKALAAEASSTPQSYVVWTSVYNALRGPLQTAVLRWYRRTARDLPWRRTRDPYAILVSEVMLQQTQVARVIPAYEAFLRRFPTLAALARAPLASVQIGRAHV